MMKTKSLAFNTLFYVLYKLLNVIFPLLTVAYVSRVILSSGVGKVASAQNIVQYFVLIASLGIPNYGIREIAKVKTNSKEISKLFSELIVINTISTVLCTICYYSFLNIFRIGHTEPLLYRIVGITILLNIFNVDWFYQGFEEYSYIAIRSFFVKLISLGCIFLFVRDASNYIEYASIYVVGIAGNNIINFINLRKYGIHFKLKCIEIKKHFKPVLYFLCTTIAIELYTMVDTTMLTAMCSDEVVGYYTNSIKIVRLVITLVAALGGVLLPRLSFYYSQGKKEECENVVNKIFSIIFFLLLPCGIGLISLADSLVPLLFGESFLGAIPTLRITALLVYALGFSNLFGTQVLLTFNEEKKLLIATIVSAITNIILNAILIPAFQQNGAASASIVSEALVTIITFIFARQHLQIRLENAFIIKTLISNIFMLAIILLIKHFIVSDTLFVLMATIIGCLAYIGSSFMLKNEIISTLKYISKR